MSTEKSNKSPRHLLRDKTDQIEALEFAQLKHWVESRLCGKDTLLADMSGNSRAYPLVAIYQRLKRTVREDLQTACLQLLNEFVSGRGLTGDAADDLLILSQSLFPEKAGDRLRLLAESPGLFSKLPIELRRRVLQTLVALGEKLETSFWTERFEKDGKSVTAICFEGIAKNSLEDALEFLTDIGADNHDLDSIILHVPAFLERIIKCGQEKVFTAAFQTRRNRLPAKLRDEIGDWCKEMGVSVKMTQEVGWLGAHFNTQILLSVSNGNGQTPYQREPAQMAAL